jgi:hypothetical protein
MQTALTVLPQDFVNSSGESNNKVDRNFGHFGRFSSLPDDMIYLSDQQGLVLTCTVDEQFYSCQLFAALVRAVTKCAPRS